MKVLNQAHMKILFIFLLSIFICSSGLSGQSIAIKAGLTSSGVTAYDNNSEYDYKYFPKTGYHLGFSYDVPVTSCLSIESGAMLVNKGFKSNMHLWWDESIQDLNTYYLQIPLSVKASFKFSKAKLYVQTGGYLALGIDGSAQVMYCGCFGDSYEKRRIKWGSDIYDDMEKFDGGLSFGAGIEFKSFQIGFSYDLGLKNIIKDNYKYSNIRNSVTYLNIGYYISKPKIKNLQKPKEVVFIRA